ncbi:MAG: hypothetical protein ACREN7_08750, partial [Candidatus Dormibacteria bacterium]
MRVPRMPSSEVSHHARGLLLAFAWAERATGGGLQLQLSLAVARLALLGSDLQPESVLRTFAELPQVGLDPGSLTAQALTLYRAGFAPAEVAPAAARL